jgi:hypothetical protein
VGKEERATEVESGGGDEQHKHKGGRGRVEEKEGIRTGAEGRRVWGGGKSNRSRRRRRR